MIRMSNKIDQFNCHHSSNSELLSFWNLEFLVSRLKSNPAKDCSGTSIEILQTIFPSIMSIFVAIPSFALLYSTDNCKQMHHVSILLNNNVEYFLQIYYQIIDKSNVK
ncbi:hypothetical protein H5410_042725 [Solanum commersonii]|uniref:Cytochrome oxidase subunit II transmembrane region profile domain-containing protein n=1 Tax=Solanum commersonii TaxID=4109 RepID=A0A9J5XV68_SOLCO|nr:hypothetical protein H5410_042725 [Solanum commersonii]